MRKQYWSKNLLTGTGYVRTRTDIIVNTASKITCEASPSVVINRIVLWDVLLIDYKKNLYYSHLQGPG